MESFNEYNKFLGNMCRRNHEYGSTGKCLRFKSNKACVECHKLMHKAYIDKHPGLWKKYVKPELARKRVTKYRLNNLEKVQKRNNKINGDYRANLHNNYIKQTLISVFKLKVSDMTPELIVAKREQMQLMRAIGRVQNAFNKTKLNHVG